MVVPSNRLRLTEDKIQHILATVPSFQSLNSSPQISQMCNSPPLYVIWELIYYLALSLSDHVNSVSHLCVY